jgi:DNA-binding HxlR family transcriptional regulator
VATKTKGQLSEYDKLAQKCPITAAMKAIGGRWKILILWNLEGKVMRFSDLERSLPSVTQAMLTQQLRSLEEDGLIHRQVYPVVPPKVEYSLTPLGRQLHATFEALGEWGNKIIERRDNQGNGAAACEQNVR